MFFPFGTYHAFIISVVDIFDRSQTSGTARPQVLRGTYMPRMSGNLGPGKSSILASFPPCIWAKLSQSCLRECTAAQIMMTESQPLHQAGARVHSD